MDQLYWVLMKGTHPCIYGNALGAWSSFEDGILMFMNGPVDQSVRLADEQNKNAELSYSNKPQYVYDPPNAHFGVLQ